MNNVEENVKDDISERVTLVIGCGGSGEKTILGMNRLLASNPHLRHRLHKKVYYFVVDTHADDLSGFQKELDRQMLKATSPKVETVLLSDTANILSDVVNPYFNEPFKDDQGNVGLDRLKTHWWFDKYDQPFRAPRVSNLILGASQCPPASYCLVWSKMEEVVNAIDRIVTEIRHNGKQNILSRLDVFIVAGLAGGTGRGTWSSVAFKTRELVLEKYKKAINPTVVLFDASCFRNVMEEYSDQALGIKINSLTGISELSCWTRVGRDGQKTESYVYNLPSMECPADEASDAIKVSLELNPESPICRAYLVCGDSPTRSLGDNRFYHEMAGAWLAAVVTNGLIAGELVNSARSYNSLASDTFEVDAVRLQTYFEAVACEVAAGNLIANTDDVSGRVDEFFKKVPIDIMARSYDDIRPNEKGSLVQKAAAHLLQQYSRALGDIASKLSSMNGSTATRTISPLLKNDKVALAAVNDAVLLAIGDLQEFSKRLETEIRSVYRGDKTKGEKPSLGRVKKFIAAIRTRLESVARLRAKSMQMRTPEGVDAEPERATMAHVNARSRRTAGEKLMNLLPGVAVPCFNPREVGELIKRPEDGGPFDGIIPEGIVCAKYPAMLKAFQSAFSGIYARIKSLESSLGYFEGICGIAKEMFTQEVKPAVCGNAKGNPFTELFCTPDTFEDAIPAPGDTMRFYKRVLKPICKDESEIKSLIGDSCPTGNGVAKFLFEAIAEGGSLVRISSSEDDDYDAQEEFLHDLMVAIKADVHLPDGFMSDQFSFKRVLERNRPFWNARLKELSGNAAKYNKFCDALERYLGFRPVGLLPPADKLMKRIADAMVVSTAPWWLVGRSGTGDDRLTVKVFFPEDSGDLPQFSGLSKKTKYVDVRAYGREECDGSEFCLMTFSRASLPSLQDHDARRGKHLLDQVRSFDYYNEPEVKKWLRWAEQKDGRSIFVDMDDNKGIGYISPIYVRDEKLRDIRWRPWAKADEAAEADDAADALVYAFLGNGVSDDKRGEVEKVLRPIKWKLMPISAGSRQSYAYSRKTYVWSDKKQCVVDDPTCPWKAGNRICTSACNLYSYLQGLGKTRATAKSKLNQRDVSEGIDLCKRLLAEKKLFDERVGAEHAALVNDLYDAVSSWIVVQYDHADEEDRAMWRALIARF